MKTSKFFTQFALGILTSSILSGCGGGGDSPASTTPTPVPPVGSCTNGGTNYPTCTPPTPVPTCPNGAPDYPTCTPPLVPAQNLQTSVPVPNLPANSEELAAFNYFNNFRASLGLGKLVYSPEISKATENHFNYRKLNDVGGFNEDPSKPGFSGISPSDQVRFAGYATNFGISGGISEANTISGAIQALINTIYHRSQLIEQIHTDFGMFGGCFTTCKETPKGSLEILLSRKTAVGQKIHLTSI